MTPAQPTHHLLKSCARLSRALRKCYDRRARDFGLTFSRMELILIVAHNEGLSQTELAEALQIEAPTLNRTLDGLTKDGFVERRPDTDDKRIRRVFLTRHAHSEVAGLISFSTHLREELIRGIPREELDAAEATISKVFANLERMTQEASNG